MAALLECTREWMRVLKPEGSLWVNLGDKYSDRADGGPASARSGRGDHAEVLPPGRSTTNMAPRKSLLGLPWRYALGCIDDLGLILRAEVIWSKPNGLPESVTDRVRRSHEQWFHLVRSPRYFSAVDEIREEHTDTSAHALSRRNRMDSRLTSAGAGQTSTANPLGKLPSSVWEVATQPLKVPAELAVDHFAAFPMEWPRRIISGWSPASICTVCGEGRRPVADRTVIFDKARDRQHAADIARRAVERTGGMPGRAGGTARSTLNGVTSRSITGYACACPNTTATTRPAIVLDPFGGTGTTALLATVLGRRGVSVDRSADYCRLAAWRTTDRGERARALGMPKPPPVIDGQGDLFDGVSA